MQKIGPPHMVKILGPSDVGLKEISSISLLNLRDVHPSDVFLLLYHSK